MRKKVWFAHGKVIKDGFYCPWCDMMRTGRIIRDLYMWRVVLKCGHVKSNVGFTMPYEELERKGFINVDIGEDPRLTARKRKLFLEFMAQWREAKDRHHAKEHLASGRLVH